MRLFDELESAFERIQMAKGDKVMSEREREAPENESGWCKYLLMRVYRNNCPGCPDCSTTCVLNCPHWEKL